MAHPLTDQLAGVSDPVQRHRIKAQAMAALGSLAGQSVTRGLFTITVSDGPTYKAGLLQFSLTITRSGKDVTPADLNPIRVTNPPVLVDDPAGDIVLTSTDPDTKVVSTRTLREDVRGAFIEIVRGLAQTRLG